MLWWSGVSDTAHAAYAAIEEGDGHGRYFVSNYDGPGRMMAVFFAFLNLVLLGVFLPTAKQLAAGRTGTFIRLIVTVVVAATLFLGEFLLNPVTTNWGGDPDAWSMVEDHVAPWYGGAGVFWFTATAATCAGIFWWAALRLVRRDSDGAGAGVRPG